MKLQPPSEQGTAAPAGEAAAAISLLLYPNLQKETRDNPTFCRFAMELWFAFVQHDEKIRKIFPHTAKKGTQGPFLCRCCRSGRLALCAALYEGVAVGALRNGGVALVGAHTDAVQTAVVFGDHVVLALGDRALDVGVLVFHFHAVFLRFQKILTGAAGDVVFLPSAVPVHSQYAPAAGEYTQRLSKCAAGRILPIFAKPVFSGKMPQKNACGIVQVLW